MSDKKGPSAVASLIHAVGFALAALLVLHIVFVLFHTPANVHLAQSVDEAAVPLALFFPGLVHAPNHVMQVLLDFGLAAGFWILVAGIIAKVFTS